MPSFFADDDVVHMQRRTGDEGDAVIGGAAQIIVSPRNETMAAGLPRR